MLLTLMLARTSRSSTIAPHILASWQPVVKKMSSYNRRPKKTLSALFFSVQDHKSKRFWRYALSITLHAGDRNGIVRWLCNRGGNKI